MNETVTSVQQVGTDCIIQLTVIFSFDGSLVGSFNQPANFVLVKQAPCSQSGPIRFVASGSFQGTVNSTAGSFQLRVRRQPA